jgi:hypothetical protein
MIFGKKSIYYENHGLDDRGSFTGGPKKGFSLFPTAVGHAQWVQGDLTSGIKPPGREVDHSFPSNAEVKNIWSYTSTPPSWCGAYFSDGYVCMSSYLVKHWDNFAFSMHQLHSNEPGK